MKLYRHALCFMICSNIYHWRKSSMTRVAAIILIFLCLLFPISFAATHDIKSQNKQLWNLRDVDIHAVIDEVSKLTGKDFLVDPRVQGRVSLVSSKPLTKKDIYPVFLSILHLHGYTAVQSGQVTKIVPLTSAAELDTPVLSSHENPTSDQIVVKVIAVKNNSAEQLVPVLRPLLPPSANLTAYVPTNSLIVSGTAANVEKIVKIVNQTDNANQYRVVVIPLRYAIAEDVVKELSMMRGQQLPGQPQIHVAADDRSNSLIVGGNLAERLHLRQLINQLDRVNSYGNGNTQVIFLHYRKAADLVPILAGIAESNYGGNVGVTQTNKASHGKKGESTVSVSIKGKGKNIEIEAEPNTNSIIITAPQNMMRVMRMVIDKLDIRPAQVLVEAAIVEIDESKMKQLGIQWGTRLNVNTGGLGIGFIHNGDISALVTALAQDGATDILSTPNIIVMDNQPADIKVGKKVPFVVGSYATNSTGALDNPYTITKREYVGLELKVTPQINQGNAVLLKIDQGNESIDDSSPNSTTGNPTTNESTIKTSVMVNNGEILVLGGLMSNQMEQVLHKFPILGDLPGVGILFRSKEHEMQKKNLMVFLRPVILHGRGQGTFITNSKYNFIRQEQIQQLNEFGYSAGYHGRPSILPPLHGKPLIPSPFTIPRDHGDGIE